MRNLTKQKTASSRQTLAVSGETDKIDDKIMAEFFLNHSGLEKPGDQPTRVFYPQIQLEFEQIKKLLTARHPDMKLENLKLSFLTENVKAIGPNVNKTRIQLHDTFISFLWCYSYGIALTLPIGGKTFNADETNKARELLRYANDLMFKDYRDWPKDLPNPEDREGHNKEYIAIASAIFMSAFLVILFHEFAHVALDHVNTTDFSISTIRQMESDADKFAVDSLMKSSQFSEMTKHLGIICAVSALAFGRDKFNPSGIHPEPEDRLTGVLEFLNYPDNHIIWGHACWPLIEWQVYFGLFMQKLDLGSYKKTFFGIISEFKDFKTKNTK